MNNTTAEKLLPLMNTAAACLVGQTVMVRLRQPIWENAGGMAYCDSRGVKSIDILPGRSAEVIFHTFLHEIAHHVLGHVDDFRWPPEIEKSFLKVGPLLKMTEEETKAHPTKSQEVQADSFADYLNHMASDRAMSLFGADDIEARLAF